MWLKLCLLLIYVTVLFLIARVIEVITWYETGSLSTRLLNPMTLSVMKLKALLHQRGVTYDGILEKSDLTQLVEGTGPAMEDEVDLSLLDEESTEETVFESGEHFYEQVEDAKDSVWIISVTMGENGNARFTSIQTWKSIKKKVSKFGIRAGVIDCLSYPSYCLSKGMVSPRLLLALPQDFKTKANVKLHTYSGSSKESSINNWIHHKLDSKITNIKNFEEFKSNWLHFKHSFLDPEIRMVLFSKQEIIPMFFSSLSLRFPGRVRFGKVDMNSKTKSEEFYSYFKNVSQGFGPLPYYLVITPEDKFLYGTQKGEVLTYEALEIYLKSLYPSLNDLFILSFFIVNIMSWFEFLQVQGTLFKRFRRLLWCFIKYNVLLIMMWLPLVGLFSLPYLDKLVMLGLKFVRLISTSSFASLIRRDFCFYSNHFFNLIISFLLYSVLVGFMLNKKEDDNTQSGSDDDDDDLWNFNEMRTLEHLFRPADSIGQIEAGLGRFGTFSTPTLWLRPSGSSDYIQRLPTWKFQDPKNHCQVKKKTPTEDSRSIEDLGPIGNKDTTRDPKPKVDEWDEKLQSDILMNKSFPLGYLPSTQCVICLDDYYDNVTLCGLPCGHSFHETCILSWLNRDNHFCPVCRWPSDQPKKAEIHCE